MSKFTRGKFHKRESSKIAGHKAEREQLRHFWFIDHLLKTAWVPPLSSYLNSDHPKQIPKLKSAPAIRQILMALYSFISNMLLLHIHQNLRKRGQELLSQEISNGNHQVVHNGNVYGCTSVRGNCSWGGSEGCFFPQQLSRKTLKIPSFCSQETQPHGLPSAPGSKDAHPRLLAGAQSL